MTPVRLPHSIVETRAGEVDPLNLHDGVLVTRLILHQGRSRRSAHSLTTFYCHDFFLLLLFKKT